MAAREIKKIKSDGRKIHLEWDVIRDDGISDTYQMTCADRAKPEFYAALEALRPHVAADIEVSDKWALSLDVRSVSLSWTPNDKNKPVMGATITAMKTLVSSHSPLVVNTPHKPERPYSENGDASCLLTEDCVDAIRKLIECAEAYIDGKRAQGTLPFPKTDAA